MPLVNTWIKNEDWAAYYQLASNKQWGAFIHNALNPTVGEVIGAHGDRYRAIGESSEIEDAIVAKRIKPTKTPKDEQTLEFTNDKGDVVRRIGVLPDGSVGIQADPRGIDKVLAKQKKGIIKSPKDAEKAVTPEMVGELPAIKRILEKNKLCKIHGTPLDDRGRCMQKGCKYA